MPAGVMRAWDRGSIVVSRRLPARYPLLVAALVLAIVVAACTGGRSPQVPVTLEAAPFQPRPVGLESVKLPASTDDVIATAAKLPETLIGQASLSSRGWRTNDHFVAAWGVPNGQAGAPPITLAIRHVDSLGASPVTSAAEAVIEEANRSYNISGPVEVGRDGQIVWFRRSDAGYTVAWGRIDNPWLYVVTASTAHEVEAALTAFAEATGKHGSGSFSTLR